MRLATVLTASSLVLVTMSAAACSSGSKTASGGASTTAPSSSAGGSAGASTAPGAGNGGSSKVDVCSLLTAAQASSIIGATYTGATPSLGGEVCTYASTAAPTPMVITVTTNAGSAAAWTDELGTLKLGGGEDPVSISGLGDRAATSTGTLGTQSGSWIIQVDGGDQTSTGGGFTKSIAVAKAVIAALH